ncbi:hypothetical protein ASC80_12275 [Afipia sp. Root123D2]|nr:hypothetical protein ASC80_12275 [Afipia sp. Root123D2]
MTDQGASLTGAKNLLSLLSCPTCGLQMVLSHIQPGQTGFERLTFVCRNCHSSETVIVPIEARRKARDDPAHE